MKATRHNGRSGKNGTYNPRHNDRRFDLENSEHIDAGRVRENIYWDCYRGYTTMQNREEDSQDISFEKIEWTEQTDIVKPVWWERIIPDRMIFVPICLMDNTFLHNLIHRQTVSLFQIKHNIVQIHICECRAYPFPPHGFYNVCLLSQNIVPEYIF